MNARPVARGFTLLEVVLAMALAIAVVAAAFAFYRQALKAREVILGEVEVAGVERAIMDHVTGELRGAMVDAFVSPGLEGSAFEMRFGTLLVPGPAAWVVQNVTEDPVPPERDLQLISYRLRTVEDEQGNLTVEGIERTSQTLASAPTAEEGADISVSLLTSRIKFLYLRYWDGAAWSESWPGQGLPGAVEINLGAQPLPENVQPADYPYPTFRRVVFVPGGAKPLGGTVIRGLGGEQP